MFTTSRLRRVTCALLAALALLAASCGDDTSQAASEPVDVQESSVPVATETEPAEQDEPTAVPAPTAQAAPTAVAEPEETAEVEETDSAPSDETAADPDAEALGGMISFMGGTDTEQTRQCMLDQAASEGVTVDDMANSSGAMIFLALLRCDEAMVDTMMNSVDLFDEPESGLTKDDAECAQQFSLDFLMTVPFIGSDDVFEASGPPDELVEGVMEGCGVDRDQAILLLG